MEHANIIASLVATSILSAMGALFLYMSRERFDNTVPYLISLSAGTIFGGVFIHLIFRMANQYSYGRVSGLLIIAGMIGSFILERTIHWHCHHRGDHREPLPYILAAGDSVHNILDGILIATSFLVSASAGIAATVAIIAHKVPKEVGDFGVMVDYGFSRVKALLVNIGVSAFMFLGAAVVLGISQVSESAVPVLLPLVVGNFVFIAGSDLLPDVKDRDNWVKHLLVFSLGVAIMYAVPFIKAFVTQNMF